MSFREWHKAFTPQYLKEYILNNSGKNPTGFQNLSGSLNAPIFWEDTFKMTDRRPQTIWGESFFFRLV